MPSRVKRHLRAVRSDERSPELPSTAPAPLGAPGAWVAVMASAGHRCECEGACGRPHLRDGGRCRARDVIGGRLQVAPLDASVPAEVAWQVPEFDLAAWCAECLAGARRAAGRVLVLAEESAQLDLFGGGV